MPSPALGSFMPWGCSVGTTIGRANGSLNGSFGSITGSTPSSGVVGTLSGRLSLKLESVDIRTSPRVRVSDQRAGRKASPEPWDCRPALHPSAPWRGRWDRPEDRRGPANRGRIPRSEEHTSELQSQSNLVCRLLLV